MTLKDEWYNIAIDEKTFKKNVERIHGEFIDISFYQNSKVLLNDYPQLIYLTSSNPNSKFEVFMINSNNTIEYSAIIMGNSKPSNVYCCHASKILITPFDKKRKTKFDPKEKVQFKMVKKAK